MPKPYAHLRAQMTPEAQAQAQAKARALLDEVFEGWTLWEGASPYRYRYIELMRREWAAPLRCDPWTLHPLMNVCDLYWRPVDEGRGPGLVWHGDNTDA